MLHHLLADRDVLVVDMEWRTDVLLGSMLQPSNEEVERVLRDDCSKRRIVVIGAEAPDCKFPLPMQLLESEHVEKLRTSLPSLFVSRIPQACSCAVNVRADGTVGCARKVDAALPHQIAPGLFLGDGVWTVLSFLDELSTFPH
jgi:hypothetical protein